MLLQGERPGALLGWIVIREGFIRKASQRRAPVLGYGGAGRTGWEAPSWKTCPSAHPDWLKCPLPLPSPTQSHRPEKEWPVRSLKVYLGVKKKLRPPTW